MKVRTDHIKDVARQFSFTEPAESFPMLADFAGQGECRFTGSITTDLSIRYEGGHFRVEGRVQAPVQVSCSRCLASFEQLLDSRFTIIFREGNASHEEEDEVELEEQDLVSASYSGDELDLLPEIGEQVALAVPLKPLCSDRCKGLCPACGADLNAAECGCSREPVNLKFSALKDFKVRS